MGREAVSAPGGAGGGTLAGRALALAAACHPEPAAVVTLSAGLLALGSGRGWGTLLVLAAIGSGQLAVGWSNDYLDREVDRAEERSDKPIAAGRIRADTVRTSAVIAFLACIPLSLASGVASAAAHFGALVCAFAYNAGLKARPISVVPFAVAFGLVPAVITLGLPVHRWPPGWALMAGALLGAGGHFAQVLKDIPADRRRGVRGLPQLLGQNRSAVAAALLLLTATAAVTFGPGRPRLLPIVGMSLSALLALGVVGATASGHPRLALRLTLAVAAIAVLDFLAQGRSL